MTDHHIDNFRSPTYGPLSLSGIVDQAMAFIKREDNSLGPQAEPRTARFLSEAKGSFFRIVVGTDSELVGKSSAHFVSAIVVHHVGHGGVYFWGSVTKDGIHDLRQRMYEEATYSLTLAQRLLEEFKTKDLPLEKFLEIHVDVGEGGETRAMISEIVGMIKGSGFLCKTKPDSFAASNVADRHT